MENKERHLYTNEHYNNKVKPHRIFTRGRRGRGRGVVGVGRHGEASIYISVNLYIIAYFR